MPKYFWEPDNLKENKRELQTNEYCLDCGYPTNNGYLFCKNCYSFIKGIRYSFDHNRSAKSIQNHYFKLKEELKQIKNKTNFIENIELMFALAEELINIYDNDYLIDRATNDILELNKQFEEKQKNKKEEKIAEEFNDQDFREKWPREYQCEDGHYVRSLSELQIDNWLYNNGYLHAYEKSVYMETNPNAIVLSDFYLPKGNVYIEFWGLEEDERYEKRKQTKIALYEKNKINRIDLDKQDVKRLTDILPRKLAKFIKNKE